MTCALKKSPLTITHRTFLASHILSGSEYLMGFLCPNPRCGPPCHFENSSRSFSLSFFFLCGLQYPTGTIFPLILLDSSPMSIIVFCVVVSIFFFCFHVLCFQAGPPSKAFSLLKTLTSITGFALILGSLLIRVLPHLSPPVPPSTFLLFSSPFSGHFSVASQDFHILEVIEASSSQQARKLR